jgi:glycosyltransferase involved in cell wall biosynthesis
VNELSVIVPVHNGQDFMHVALASMRQNHRDGIEFIIVDDHSEDETPWIVEAALPSMPYVTFVRNPENFGVAHSRNLALELAQSRYLSYFDADDWYLPGHLPRMIGAIQDLGTDMVRTDHVHTARTTRRLVIAPEPRRDIAIPAREGIGLPGELSIVDYPYLWAGIYDLTKIDRSLFRFHEHLRTAADRPWFWRMHLNTNDYAVASGLAGYFYRKDPNPRALTQGGNPSTLHFADAYHLIFDLALGSGEDELITKAAYGGLRITIFHIRARARLSAALQSELFARSAVLLSRLEPAVFEAAVNYLDRAARRTLRRIYRHGAKARAQMAIAD